MSDQRRIQGILVADGGTDCLDVWVDLAECFTLGDDKIVRMAGLQPSMSIDDVDMLLRSLWEELALDELCAVCERYIEDYMVGDDEPLCEC